MFEVQSLYRTNMNDEPIVQSESYYSYLRLAYGKMRIEFADVRMCKIQKILRRLKTLVDWLASGVRVSASF